MSEQATLCAVTALEYVSTFLTTRDYDFFPLSATFNAQKWGAAQGRKGLQNDEPENNDFNTDALS